MDRYRLRYLGGAACLLLATAFSLSIPWTVKSAVDALERDGLAARVGPYVLLILALAAAHGAARLASRFAMLGAGQWVEHDIRADLYARLLALPAAFYQRHRTGDLMSRVSNDISTLRALAGFGSVMLISTTLAFGGALAAMWLIDPWLTLFAMAPFPALVIIAKRFHHDTEVRSTAVQEQLGALSAKVQENLTGMPVVRAYTMEAREVAEFERLNAEYLARNMALARIQAVSWPLMGLVSGLGVLIVMWLGGKAVVDGRISLGAFVAFNGYLTQLAWPTIALGWTLASIQRGLAAMARVTEVLDERAVQGGAPERAPALPESADDRELLPGGSVEFRGLTFAYDVERGPVLRDVSFGVPAGAVVAVVGPTGSGKSTLGALLCRLHEPPRGTVWVGGQDVLDLPLGRLRRSVGYVPQESFLFSRPLRDNVRLADESAGPERLEAVARTAGLVDDLGALPRRLGHGGRRARAHALGRPATACGAGARAGGGSTAPRPGRRAGLGGCGQGVGDHPRAPGGGRRPHDAADDAPSEGGRRGRRDRGARRRPRGRARPARRPPRRRRPLRAPLARPATGGRARQCVTAAGRQVRSEPDGELRREGGGVRGPFLGPRS
jgi:ATP-binding cassette subfamily B multidrug efflux pump